MVEAGFCRPDYQVKLAAKFKANPQAALDALQRIAKLSNTTEPSGQGVHRKTAHVLGDPETDSQESEDWTVMAREGA